MRAAVRATVENIEPWDGTDRDHRRDALDWIDSGAPLYRTAKPATPPKHLVSYTLLVDARARAALLIDHRLSGLWLPAGGHVEPDEEPWVAARRELTEELGVDAQTAEAWAQAPFFLTVTRTIGRARHVDVSLWYTFTGSRSQEIRPDGREASDVRWWSFDDIRHGPTSRFDPHLPRAAAKLAHGLDRIR